MQPILGRLRQMVNLVVIVVGFSHCLSVTVPNQRAAVKFQLVGWWKNGQYTAGCGCSSVGRARASQARGRGFEPRCPLHSFYGFFGQIFCLPNPLQLISADAPPRTYAFSPMQARHHPRHSGRQSDWQRHDLQYTNALSSNRFCQLGQGFFEKRQPSLD